MSLMRWTGRPQQLLRSATGLPGRWSVTSLLTQQLLCAIRGIVTRPLIQQLLCAVLSGCPI